ncbi:hypothetical protein E3N88_37929 [Mikania micrantha]|uniref:Uncharacterized protein n=1 Tax=Mikania micrantha TaxID=192012 RepID=A0A5N6LUW1_9ASTR|nr:hypothetical protein E3N88_37929 [Mikania micrantha]
MDVPVALEDEGGGREEPSMNLYKSRPWSRASIWVFQLSDLVVQPFQEGVYVDSRLHQYMTIAVGVMVSDGEGHGDPNLFDRPPKRHTSGIAALRVTFPSLIRSSTKENII